MTDKEKLDDIEKAYNYGLLVINEWENKFLSSIGLKILAEEKLSPKQSQCLDRIYGKIE